MKKVLVFLIMATLSLSADPLMTYVGSKAKSMGGAFTAISNNNSAMYFNPAGLVNFEGNASNLMVTAEGGSGVEYNEKKSDLKDRLTTGTSYFLGVSYMGQNGGGGLAYYTLFDLTLKSSTNNKYYDENISVMSISIAKNLVDSLYPYGGKLSIGITGAYASTWKDDDSINDSELDVSGGFFSIGAKYRVLNHRAIKLDIGINYRSHAKLKGSDVVAVGIPQELAYGVAVAYGTEFGLFTLSADLKSTAYQEATSESDFDISIPDVTTKNIGFEYANSKMQFRAGMYNSKYKYNTDDAEIIGITGGIGYITDGGISLECAADHRTYIFTSESVSPTYLTVSINYAISNL